MAFHIDYWYETNEVERDAGASDRESFGVNGTVGMTLKELESLIEELRQQKLNDRRWRGTP